MHKLLIALAAIFAGAASATPPPPPPPAPPPRLLIVIGVDHLGADLFDEYRPHFTGGFARLAGGTAFRNGYQSHATTETCPGYSTLLTGAHPARSGIVANRWVDSSAARPDKTIYCLEDESVAGSTSRNYTPSPVHLRVPTLGERLKARSPQSLSVSVAGKDRAAIAMGGRADDQRWFWKGQQFVTDLLGDRVPAAVARTNAAVAAMIAAPQMPLEPSPHCAAKSRVFQVPGGREVGNGRLARDAGDASEFRSSPAFDGATLALSAALIDELKLGSDTAPDILAIGLSALDDSGHGYGPGGQEMCLHLQSIDRDLGDFFRFLDQRGIDYAVALTGDHGGLDIPERLRVQGVAQAAWVDAALGAEAVGKAIAAKLKLAGPLLSGDHSGDIFVDGTLAPADRRRVIAEALATYRAHPQVEAAFSAAELGRVALPTTSPDRWTLAERVRASFDPRRSGDLYVVLRPHVQPIAKPSSAVSTHGSPWDYDRRVPILMWRPAMPATPRNEAIGTVDIMPTLAAMLGIPFEPSTIDGKCLPGISGVACPPR
jgi:predicted AlkP superfamily pyrophosphatase or phosphodiesterase